VNGQITSSELSFMGDCEDCGAHSHVRESQKNNEGFVTRCAMCIWKLTRISWQPWRAEESKLFIGRPVLYGPDNKPLAAARA
jgi:hypothetical protein